MRLEWPIERLEAPDPIRSSIARRFGNTVAMFRGPRAILDLGGDEFAALRRLGHGRELGSGLI